MKPALEWLKTNHATMVKWLADQVAIPSISTDGDHASEIDRSAALTCDQMREAGLQNVEILKTGDSYPYAYGEWLGAPGKPTVLLYAHHDVQPTNFLEQWLSDPWMLTARDGRLYGRGSADDKGGIVAELGAVASYLKSTGSLPVNVKMLIEGEEEVGSKNLFPFFAQHKQKLQSDIIVVCDTENAEIGVPSLTYSLRGIVTLLVEVESAKLPVHSGMAGGALADAAIALNVVLARLYPKGGKLSIPGYYDKVRPFSTAEKRAVKRLGHDLEKMRDDYGVLPGVEFAWKKGSNFYETTWRKPAITVIAQEASSLKGASNQVLPKATALVSCRIVPDQDPEEVTRQVSEFLTKDPPWGVKVTVKPHSAPVLWWMTDPTGPAFEAALAAQKAAFGTKGIPIGTGGTIGFVGPLAELFGGAPALLFGIEDSKSNAHAPNESLHEVDWGKLMASLALLFENLAKEKPAPPAKVEATQPEAQTTESHPHAAVPATENHQQTEAPAPVLSEPPAAPATV